MHVCMYIYIYVYICIQQCMYIYNVWPVGCLGRSLGGAAAQAVPNRRPGR